MNEVPSEAIAAAEEAVLRVRHPTLRKFHAYYDTQIGRSIRRDVEAALEAALPHIQKAVTEGDKK